MWKLSKIPVHSRIGVKSGLAPARRGAFPTSVLIISVFLCTLLALRSAASEQSFKSTLKDQETVSITIYNSDLGLVKDVRNLSLVEGILSLTFEGVASRIDPTSVSIRSLDHPDALEVLEQNFEYDLISPEKLMEKYIGKDLELVTKGDKGEKVKKAKLIGVEKGYVYEMDGKIAVNPKGRVVLPSLPEGLISKPSLIWMLNSGRREHTVEASYLTSGINWKANYVAVLSKDDKKLDLSGWVTIDNKSGASYKDASLKLIAGDINRVTEKKVLAGRVYESALGAAAEQPQFTEKAFFEYHMYNLQRRTTIKNNQTKQIRLMDSGGISVEKKFVYSPATSYFYSLMRSADTSTKVGVFLSLKNSKTNRLGMPLPKGIVRVFKKDEDGALEFLGEDEIDHTPEDETIRVKIGDAFDVVAERIQTDFQKSKNSFESAYKITIRNHKDQDIVVSVVERLLGDWKIKESTHKFIKESATRVRFDVPVAKDGETELLYRAVVKR